MKKTYLKCVLIIEDTSLEERFGNKSHLAALKYKDKYFDVHTLKELDLDVDILDELDEDGFIELGESWEKLAKSILLIPCINSLSMHAHNLTSNVILSFGFHSDKYYSDEYAYCLVMKYIDGSVSFWSRDTIEECYLAALNQEESGYKGRFEAIEVSETKIMW